MLYTLLAYSFVSHLNDTPTPDSFQEPGAVFSGLPHRVSETAPFGYSADRLKAAERQIGICGQGPLPMRFGSVGNPVSTGAARNKAGQVSVL